MSLIPSEIASGAIELTLALSDDAGAITGEAPTVRVRVPGTSDLYLDFADWTFKIAGWTTKEAPLTETVDGGTYAVDLIPANLTNLPANTFHLIAEYTNAAPNGGIDVDVVSIPASFYTIPADTTAQVWDEPAAAHQLPLSMGDFQDQAASGAAFRGATWTVLAGGTLTTVPTDATRPDDFYDSMQVSIVFADGSVVARNVQGYTAGVFTVAPALPSIPAAGDTVEVWKNVATAAGISLTAQDVWQYVITPDIGITDSAAQVLWAASLQDIDLAPISDAIDILLRRLSQVGVNIRYQLDTPLIYALSKGDTIESVVYVDGEPIDQTVLDSAEALTMRIENTDTGARLDLVGVAPGLGVIAYTLIDGDGVFDIAGRYKIQGFATPLTANPTDIRIGEQRLINVSPPLLVP